MAGINKVKSYERWLEVQTLRVDIWGVPTPGCKSHFPICWGAGGVITHLITLASIVAQ